MGGHETSWRTPKMSNAGVFAVDRGVWDHPAFSREPFTEREAWMWLVGAAAWREWRIRANGVPVTLQRGEFCFSVRFLATKWSWLKDRVQRFLVRLKKHDMIRDTSRDNAHVYIISKYSDYQTVGRPDRDVDQDAASDATATGPRQDRDKEETLKHLSIESPSSLRSEDAPAKPKAASKATRKAKTPLPDDCPSPKCREAARDFWAVHARFDLVTAMEDQAQQFRDHHLKHDSRWSDWDAAWRTWMRNALKYPPKEGANGRRIDRGQERADIARGAAIDAITKIKRASGDGAQGLDGGAGDGQDCGRVAILPPRSTGNGGGDRAPRNGVGSDLPRITTVTSADEPPVSDFRVRSV